MDKIFESKFMKSLQNFGDKIGSNKAINSIQGALMGSMGIIMVGAIFQIIATLLTSFKILSAESSLYSTIYMPYNLTMNCLSLWFVFQLGYQYSKQLRLKPMTGALNATICFLMVATTGARTASMETLTTSFLGSTGLFVAIIVGLVTVRIYNFCVVKNIIIKMPDVVPPFLADSFSSIIPLLFSVVTWLLVDSGVIFLTNLAFGTAMNLPTLITAIFSIILSPFTGFWGMLALGLIAGMMW
ncbi:MAG: PTS transporter subunit EIIC, partial [Lactovum sp.]